MMEATEEKFSAKARPGIPTYPGIKYPAREALTSTIPVTHMAHIEFKIWQYFQQLKLLKECLQNTRPS